MLIRPGFKRTQVKTRRYSPELVMKPVVKTIPLDDGSSIDVTTYIQVEDVHPIPPEITVDLFSVSNMKDSEQLISAPYLSSTTCEQVFNSYRGFVDVINKSELPLVENNETV